MNQRNFEEEAWRSPVSAQVFQLIHTGEADYTSKIATKLGTQPQTISNYIKGLRQAGYIERAVKSGRKVKYETDLIHLVDKWYDELEKLLRQDYEDLMVKYDIDYSETVELPEDIQNRKQILEQFLQNEDEITNFSIEFIDNYLIQLKLRNDQSLKDLFFYEYAYSLLFIYYQYLNKEIEINDEKLNWLGPLMNALIRARSTGYSYSILKDTIEDFNP